MKNVAGLNIFKIDNVCIGHVIMGVFLQVRCFMDSLSTLIYLRRMCTSCMYGAAAAAARQEI